MPQINVAILGGTMVGKSSLVAVMDNAFSAVAGIDDKLSVKLAGDHLENLEEKRRELKSYFAGQSQTFVPNQSSDDTVLEYEYQFAHRGNDLGFSLKLYDIPGSHLQGLSGINKAQRLTDNAQVIVVAVDTPAMMEDMDEEHHLKTNKVKEITHILKRSIENTDRRAMVIMVPLKCEQYYHAGQMKKVRRTIRDAYSDLYEILEENRETCALAITPVLTMSGAEFVSYDQPQGVFQIREERDEEPKFQEHPALLMLQHLLCMVLHYKANPKLAKRELGKGVKFPVSENALLQCKREIGAFLDKHESVGFEIVYDPWKLDVRRILADFNILMFGARRAGKSSVLASMIDSFEKLKLEEDYQIRLKAEPSTQVLLDNRKGEMRNTFEQARHNPVAWSMTEAATDASYHYEFEMYFKESPVPRTINFMDIPGEWLKSPDKEKTLKSELENCQIIIIAIDTPHMMEAEGQFHSSFNLPGEIYKRFKSMNPDNIPRMVLFVPIKCEKYYHEGRMEEVNARVKESYELLIKHFAKGRNAKNYMVAITPILTFGGVVFDRFEVEKSGFVSLVKQGSLRGRPKAVYYKIYDVAPRFEPKYCEQPVLYLLSFILDNVNKIKKSLGDKIVNVFVNILLTPLAIFGGSKALKELWSDIFEDEIVAESARKAKSFMKIKEDGYEIIQNPFEGE